MGLISLTRSAYGQLSLKRVVLFCLQFCLVIVCSLTTPFIVRWFFAVPFVELSVPLDFVFRTCDQQLSGVCSYPEATVALDQVPTKLDHSYYYGFTVGLTLFDTSQNRALGLSLVQLQAKDEALAVVSTYQKTLLVKHTPPSTGFLVKIRNIVFFPLYLVGYFSEPVAEPLVLVLTNKHRENSKAPTKFLAVQIQNRFIQIESGTLFIHAHVGWSGYVFTEYPLITYVSLFSISASIYFIIFALYWASKGLRLMAVEPAENLQQEGNPNRPNGQARVGLRSKPGLRHPSSAGKHVVDEPPPDIWNRDELPECPVLSDIPGWNVVPGSEDDRNRPPQRPDIVSNAPSNTPRRFRDEEYPRNTH
ncbi:Seipin [Aphelenchoides avenae]|nr:Seipin [Aphelenchus avenae]